MELETFLKLPAEEVADLVRTKEAQVCVFPINGTRRWFMLEHADKVQGDFITAYMDISARRHMELYKMFFDHGVETLITPIFGGEIMERGEEYVQKIGVDGMERLANHPDFLKFYEENGVHVRFYGDYRKRLRRTRHAYLCDRFAEAMERTKNNTRYRLFYGVFADDAIESIAEQNVRHFLTHGRAPNRRAIVEAYYGEFVSPASLFIGFDRFWAFDYPLLSTGSEDLYFTVAPSPYLTQTQLRSILFDHLYLRRQKEPDYESVPPADWGWMRGYYTQNRGRVFGVGQRERGFWIPKDNE
jgi:tuberculosinol/isotuberculosinol synthase